MRPLQHFLQPSARPAQQAQRHGDAVGGVRHGDRIEFLSSRRLVRWPQGSR